MYVIPLASMSERARWIASVRPSVARNLSRSVDTGGLLTVCPPRPVMASHLAHGTRGLKVALAGPGASSRFTDSKPCIMTRYKPLVRPDLVTGRHPLPAVTSNGGKEGLR